MRIGEGRILTIGDIVEVSAAIDGFRLWYKVPTRFNISGAADPFVAAALLPAMLRGETLTVDPALRLSPKLLENIGTLQEIHHSWNPIFRIVPIEAATAPSRPLNEGVLAFFSGGVDSTYTFLKRREELTHLVFIQGFDFFANEAGSGPFGADDIADLSQLAFRLRERPVGLAGLLRAALSRETLQDLAVHRIPGRVSEGIETRLAEEIERVLAGPSIWERRLFAGLPLRPATRELLNGPARPEDVPALNRLLIEEAFPREIARRDDSVYRRAVARNARFANGAGKALVPVSTNHFAFGYRYNLSRNLTQGGALASVALLLGFPRAYMPGAYAYSQLVPLGQHPLTDPLYSSESVEILHEGAEARRVDKIVRVAGDPAALANLRVCFSNMNDNCGRCAKCLRTMIPLARLGVKDAPFPALPPLGAIRKMPIANDIERVFLQENLDGGPRSADRRLDRALKACLRRYDRRQLLKALDRFLLGGRLRRARMRRAARRVVITRIDTTPPPPP